MKETESKDVQEIENPELERRIEEMTDCVRRYTRQLSDNAFADTEVAQVINDAIRSSGKMIRPRLLLMCGSLGPLWEGNRERLCMLAAMVELTHLASLIHDDIVDEAPYRRGDPSIHSKYGRNAAVYAGDFLMARVYRCQAENHFYASGAVLASAIEKMCAGEIGQDACRYDEKVTAERYLANIKGKTAALFRAACRIGAFEAGCSEELVNKLEVFGENIGFMLQLRDDLLDFTSDGKLSGKEMHRDFLSGIYTMPLIAALEDTEAAKVLVPIMRENAKRRLSAEEVSDMEEKVVRFGGIEKTCGKIRALAEKNREILELIGYGNGAAGLMKKLAALLEV